MYSCGLLMCISTMLVSIKKINSGWQLNGVHLCLNYMYSVCTNTSELNMHCGAIDVIIMHVSTHVY